MYKDIVVLGDVLKYK